jgi:putative ABC transport system permease protein
MIRNYIKVAFRNLVRNKTFSFINIFGLALSMSVCLLVIMHVKDQLSYDTFHPHPGRTYRIIADVTNKEGRPIKLASTPLPLADKLVTDFGLVENFTRIYPYNGAARSGPKELNMQDAFVDSAFFSLFGFTLQAGDPHTALSAPNSIVLSQETAEKFFGQADPLGQVIAITALGDFRVTGVINKAGKKSHVDKDAYLSMSSVPQLEKAGKLAGYLRQWSVGAGNAYTYVLLQPNTKEKQLSSALHKISTDLVKDSPLKGKESFSFIPQPLDDIILGEEMAYPLGNTGSLGKMTAEVVIGFIILLSACFNYTNLSVARSLKRGKEVGVRKVSGAVRSQIFTQFLVESLLTSFLALILGYVMLQMMKGQSFTQEIIGGDDFPLTAGNLIWLLAFALFAGLLAGILPALALSSFKPVEVLKNLSTVKLFLGNNFRKSLTVIQFTLSLVAAIFTLIFFRQFDYMANADPGFKRDHIITIPVAATELPVLKHELEQLNGITNVTAMSSIPGKEASGSTHVRQAPGKDPIGMDYYHADAGIIKTFGLTLLAGTSFQAQTEDGQPEKQVLINELALQTLHFASAQQAIGQSLWIDDSVQVQITGVVKNFSHRGMALPYMPLLIRNKPDKFHYLIVNTESSLPPAFLNTVSATWKKQYPNQPFEGKWLSEEWMSRNRATGTVGMLGFLTLITITIACLGLLGMVIYTTETRRKEIGIRKVMGASVSTIISLLTRNFLKLLFIAGAIALPVGYLLGFFFLNIFANRITIGIDILLISFSVMLLVAIITIGTQIYRVAIANPVNSLRSE